MRIEKILMDYKTKTITEKELKEVIDGSYDEMVAKIKQLVAEDLLQPILASRTNGRKPPIYNKYRIVRPEMDYSNAIERIKLLHPKFDHQAYFNNPALYLKHKKDIEDLSCYLWRSGEELEKPMSINERSLKIWGKEKNLKENYSLLNSVLKFKNQDLTTMLNFYETPEPFFEYIHQKCPEMNVLIIENKDTWYTLRKVMTECNNNMLLGRDYHAILYGEGRKITRAVGRLEEYNKEMLAGSKNQYYYFGDLDFEGISIFMDLANGNKSINVRLCSELYEVMLSESNKIELPESRDKRVNDVDINTFVSYLSPEGNLKARSILDKGRYVPQEIINYQLLTALMKKR